jgi:hypothetical protein
LNQAPIPHHYLISCSEDYTAPPTTINPILRRTVAILGLLRVVCPAPDCSGNIFNRKLVNAAFRTISLVGTQIKHLPIGGSATYIPDLIREASGLVLMVPVETDSALPPSDL